MSTTLSLLIVGNESTRKVPLGSAAMRVGRDPSADILIADPSISRHQFTITPHGEGVLVEMSPQSRYSFVKNGRSAMRLEVFPGEFFQLGPYKFELHAVAELPQAQRRGLETDPGGPVDVDLAEERLRVAPRWRTHGEDGGPAAAPPSKEAESPRWIKVALPAAVLLLGGYLAYDFLSPPPPAVQAEDVGAPPDLLAEVQPIECKGVELCLARAQDLYQIGVKLSDSGSRDLITLYKAAKQLRRASLALGSVNAGARIPDLAARALAAKQSLELAFSDAWFRYRRAITAQQPQQQFDALRTILSVCREDRHGFCESQELTYQRLHEQLQESR